MEKIKFYFAETDETVDFFVSGQTKINGIQYLLVTEEETGDTDAYILKNVTETVAGTDPDDEEAVYEMVEDDQELEVVSRVFEQELEDVSIEM